MDTDPRLTFTDIYRNLNGTVALMVAETTPLKKQKGEYDTEFVKRIVATYLTLAHEIGAHTANEGT